ncbi:VOC family protein [uncultured Jatrophihabitans sp.]|uniref:VOC family protein n=1 Tax=uncultured Jatrophihabitans sp. TaxID=1610747 RepID=UPI0035CA00CE
MNQPPDLLDHLVLATPDLAATVADFAARSGVNPAPGGSHTGLGTANALVGLGGDAYLEIVGPDPQQPEPSRPRPFGIDDLDAATLVTWAVHPPDVDAVIARVRQAGYDPGDAKPMSRRTPDGEQLSWRLTPPRGLVPFLIDWGDTPHPSSRGLPAVELASFALRHADPASLRRHLDALQLTIHVEPGEQSALVAFLATPRGPLVL